MSATVALPVFVVGVIASLGMSWLLVSRLERIGERLGLSEAILGLLAALAADAPEVTSAVTALAHHEQKVGAGVVLGSNVFNLAALLGLGALVAGRITLHRRVVLLDGAVALWIAAACLAAVLGLLPPIAALAVALVVLVPYVAVSAVSPGTLARWPLSAGWARWLTVAVAEEEEELDEAIRPRRGRPVDVAVAVLALGVVVGASVAMERAGSSLGDRYAIPPIIVGGLVLAVITSLPNAVAAVYLASRGRGAATLSTALNSNTLNVVVGLLLPAAVIGMGAPTGQSVLVAAWSLGLTVLVLAFAYRGSGLTRPVGVLVIAAYLVFVGALWAGAWSARLGPWTTIAPAAAVTVVAATWLVRGSRATGRARLADRPTLLPEVSSRRLFTRGMLWCCAVAALDAVTGRHLVLIGLLIVGPCCVLLTGHWRLTALAGAWAVALAVACGVPDGIFGTGEHVAFITAVTIVAAVSTAATAVAARYRPSCWT